MSKNTFREYSKNILSARRLGSAFRIGAAWLEPGLGFTSLGSDLGWALGAGPGLSWACEPRLGSTGLGWTGLSCERAVVARRVSNGSDPFFKLQQHVNAWTNE